MASPDFVRFTGHRFLAQRLVLATLTGRPVHISGIRSGSPTQPGLAPHEVSLLRLLEAVTNGSSFQISYTGTTITYHPGLITGTVAGAGATADGVLEHHVPAGCARGLTYFLLPLALLAPFSKAHVHVRFTGPGVVTSATDDDVSVDAFRLAVLPLLGLFGIPPARIELDVRQRSGVGGSGGSGGRGDRRGHGVVELRFASQVRLPKTLHLHRGAGRVRRIAGVAYSVGVAAANNKRMIHAARGVLNALTGEIKIAEAPPGRADTDAAGKDAAGRDTRPGLGFGLCLVAESSVPGVLYAADAVAPPQGGVLAEDVGTLCAHRLLEAVAQGGCVGWAAAPTVLTLMAMGSEDVGRVRLSKDVVGTEEVVALARDLQAFGASSWGLRPAADDDDAEAGADATAATDDVVVSVKGIGLGNVGRKVA